VSDSVNRELAALKRMFRLAVKGERLQRIPPIEMLKENNARRGFFEREQFEAVRRHLPEDLRNLVTLAYVTGWRIADELSYRSSGVRSISRPVRCAAAAGADHPQRVPPARQADQELQEVLGDRVRGGRLPGPNPA
jgi:hypothetical protein